MFVCVSLFIRFIAKLFNCPCLQMYPFFLDDVFMFRCFMFMCLVVSLRVCLFVCLCVFIIVFICVFLCLFVCLCVVLLPCFIVHVFHGLFAFIEMMRVMCIRCFSVSSVSCSFD